MVTIHILLVTCIALIQQFLSEINWGELDYLIIDSTDQLDHLLIIALPGTSDEHISIVNFLRDVGIDGGILVTTPQEVALADVRKEIRFCQRSGVRIVGIVENMSSVEVGSTMINHHISLAWMRSFSTITSEMIFHRV